MYEKLERNGFKYRAKGNWLGRGGNPEAQFEFALYDWKHYSVHVAWQWGRTQKIKKILSLLLKQQNRSS